MIEKLTPRHQFRNFNLMFHPTVEAPRAKMGTKITAQLSDIALPFN